MGVFRLVVLLGVLLTPITARADTGAETRVALVVGVSAYKAAPPLPNTLNDARGMDQALRRRGRRPSGSRWNAATRTGPPGRVSRGFAGGAATTDHGAA
jgi:hypothetical protein